eukprot:COSAG06_NODE_31641_length_518_cov_0.749403_1_plen_122_part_01
MFVKHRQLSSKDCVEEIKQDSHRSRLHLHQRQLQTTAAAAPTHITRSDYIAALDKAKQAAAAAAAAAEVADDNSDGSAAAGGVVSEHDVAVVGGEFGVSGSVEQKELLQVIQAYTAGWSSSG